MASINLGNVVGNRILGLSSGIDSENLIKELSKLKQKPIDDLNTKITGNATKATKFGELNSLLTNLKSAANYLRNPVGINSAYSNIFKYRVASLTSSTITASSYLSATANPGSLVGNNSIQIGQLAKALEQRSASFNSRAVDATTAATGSYFTAGTFQIGSGIVSTVAGTSLTGYQIAETDYDTEGTATGVLTGAGIHNFQVVGANGGQTTLKGGVSATGTSNINSGTAILSITIGGVVYSTSAIQVDATIGADTGIASGTTLTFTTDPGGLNETSFDITTSSDIVINDTQANLDDFVQDVGDALEDQSIYQARQITNFTDANVKSPLTGLTSTDIKLYSDSFNNTTRSFGNISGFNVEYGAGNTSIISVEINGETFRASSLGTSLNAPLTLTSISSDKELRIDLTGVNVDLANADDATELERAFDYAFGTRKLVSVNVTAGQSLNDIRFNIDQLSAQTGATASIVKISNNDYRFVLKATSEGIDNKYEIFDTGGVLTNTGILDTNPLTAEGITQAAQDAKIRVDGIELTRSSNTISDAIENVTLNLLAVTPDYDDNDDNSARINLAIANDVEGVTERIVSFLDAYNALRVFATEQNQRDKVTNKFLDDSILGGDTALQTLVNSLLTEINAAVSNTTDSEYDSLADAGITSQDFAGSEDTVATKNILVYDSATLKNKIEQNFDKLREIFEFKFSSSSSDLAIFSSSNSVSLTDFKLDIDSSRPAAEQVKLLKSDGTDYLDGEGNNVYLNVSGNKLSGKAGSVIDGLEFIYTGDGTDVITISFSQGIADRVYNLSNNYVKAGGVLSNVVNDLADKNESYQTDIQNLQVRLDKYIETLRARFSALEQAINSVNNILQLLDANSAAANKNS